MKRTTLLLLVLYYSFAGFSQTKDKSEMIKAKSFSITSFYHKNLIYVDTLTFDVEFPIDKATDVQRQGLWHRSFADRSFADTQFTSDSIPKNASVNINGIIFENIKILSKMTNYDVLLIKKDSSFTYIYDTENRRYNRFAHYKSPRAIIYQNHPNLPLDFFLFKQNTLEPIRYKCSSYSPVLDVFNTADSLVFSDKPRIMIDGRLQPRELEFDDVNMITVKKIEVFSKEDARTYFGQKVKLGLISIVTNDSKFNLDWTLANTRVIGEIQDKKEQWKVIKDTLLTSPEQFIEFRKSVYSTNGAIYMINGEFETEKVNRKTIDLDAMESVKIVSGKRTNLTPLMSYITNNAVTRMSETVMVANDTVFIQTEKERWASNTHIGISSISSVMSQLKRIRNTEPDPTPLYIVDNQEIDAEKLKLYKSKELEFVESLQGCDAISRYGKRAEFGVVIYRKKKIE